jgi:predicted ATPase
MSANDCACTAPHHEPRLVVLTGGPGAGKTAALETIRRNFCEHVVVLPEAASIVFGGGFPRAASIAARLAAQRAIFRVQRELEGLALEDHKAAIVLCDRGTIDGLAYWPLDDESFFTQNECERGAEIGRYASVIHLRTPAPHHGYDHKNPLRIETAHEANAIDRAIARAWDGHPHRVFVESTSDFLEKVAHVVALIRDEIPPCCRARHAVMDREAPVTAGIARRAPDRRAP